MTGKARSDWDDRSFSLSLPFPLDLLPFIAWLSFGLLSTSTAGGGVFILLVGPNTLRGVADFDTRAGLGAVRAESASSSVEQRSITAGVCFACFADRVFRLVLIRAGGAGVDLLFPATAGADGTRDEWVGADAEPEDEEGGALRTLFLILSIVGRGELGGGGVNVELRLECDRAGELERKIGSGSLFELRLGTDDSGDEDAGYSNSSSSSSGLDARSCLSVCDKATVGRCGCVKNDLKAAAFSPPVDFPIPLAGAFALALVFGLALAANSSS
jgi:hypothetical protein